jgi:hypothetical protein
LTDVAKRDGELPDDPREAQEAVRRLLAEWREQGRKFWEMTARVGEILCRERERTPDKDWPAWLAAVGLAPYWASVFMHSTRITDRMELHPPESIEAVAKMIPKGDGSAFDREQAAFAHRLSQGGMSNQKIGEVMSVTSRTLRRWLDPQGHAKILEAEAERARQRRAEAAEDRRRKLMARLKAKSPRLYTVAGQVRRVAVTLDEEMRAAEGREQKRAIEKALNQAYAVEDALAAAVIHL